MWRKLKFSVNEKKADVTATLVVNGQIVAKTRRSHGSGKLTGRIPHYIRQQMYLSEPQFAEAIACPLDYEGYLTILCSKGRIDGEICKDRG
jgi:hypothetical protein